MGRMKSFLEDESGQSATEYILIIGLVTIPIYAVFKLMLEKFLNIFISNVMSSFTRG